MSGETNLKRLIQSMQPELHPDEYVFANLSSEIGRYNLEQLNIVCMFKESKGTTLILKRKTAESIDMDYTYPCRMITLSIHSSLDAVGFLASITKVLAENNISVNAVSAYYHDHLFVPSDKAEKTMDLLRQMAKGAA